MTKSYWQETELIFKSKDLAQENHYDIIIVGAGIAGLSTAYWLEKKDPQLKIVIIDQGPMGIGASGKNAGFLTCGSVEHFNKLLLQFGLAKAIEIWRFSELNHQLLVSEIIQTEMNDVEYEKTGSCTVAAGEVDFLRYQKLANTMLNEKIDVKLLDNKQLFEKYGVHESIGGIEYKQDAVIHPIKLLKKLKSKLKNTQFLFNSAVNSYSQSSLNCSVRLQNKSITGSKLIFCLNGYTDTLLPELKNIIKPQRGQILVTEKLPKFINGPCYLTKYLCYFRQLTNGGLLVGGFRNEDLTAENTNQDKISDKIQNALSEFTHNYFKITKNIRINYRWSGIMGFTSDGQMILGQHPKQNNIYIMAGCSGHGMGLSFHAAKQLVDNIFQKNLPDHLDIKRFFEIAR